MKSDVWTYPLRVVNLLTLSPHVSQSSQISTFPVFYTQFCNGNRRELSVILVLSGNIVPYLHYGLGFIEMLALI
ncbi:5742_t:CDS:2, partial [Funneliformis caledonium]